MEAVGSEIHGFAALGLYGFAPAMLIFAGMSSTFKARFFFHSHTD
jgi:hypothetical protein